MTVKLLTEHHLEFLSLIGGCKGSPGPTLVKMPHCGKSHVMAQNIIIKSVISYILSFSVFLSSDGKSQSL